MADAKETRQSVSLTPTQLSKARDAIKILTYLTSADPSNRPTASDHAASGACPGSSGRRTEDGIIIEMCVIFAYLATPL